MYSNSGTRLLTAMAFSFFELPLILSRISFEYNRSRHFIPIKPLEKDNHD